MDNKQQIIESATNIIIQKGINNTSLKDIAENANISKGTLYYYFTAKHELIFAITEQYMDVLTSDILLLIDENKNSSLADLLYSVFDKLLQAETRSYLHIYLIKEALTDNKELQRRFNEKYNEWKQLFITKLLEIYPEYPNPEVLAEVSIACIDGLLIQSKLNVHNSSLQDIVNLLADI